MKYYIIRAEDADDLIFELLKCKECVYFCEEITKRKTEYSCLHSKGMGCPEPEGYCSYAAEVDDLD